MDYLIEHQCPQCGAPAILEETDRLFSCQFCKVRSYLLAGKYFRYFFRPRSENNREIIYIPYWRLKGLMFSSFPERIDHRFVDFSSLAIQSEAFPKSVGLRPQALKLKFIPPGEPGLFVKPSIPIGKALEFIEGYHNRKLGDPTSHITFVGDTLSLIYSPFYVDHNIMDAVLDRPVITDNSVDFNLSDHPVEIPDWPVRFIPVLCPDCGWDLEGEKESLTLICRNCSSAWFSAEKGLLKLKYGIIPGRQKKMLYLPFWRIRAEISGIRLESYEDLIKIANLPKVAQKGMEEKNFYFWIQAFKVRPGIFLRIAKKLTLAQPDQEMVDQFPDSRLYPVTLSVTEAVDSLKINLAGIVRPAKNILTRLNELQIKPTRFKLVYIPFHEGHHELSQDDFHLTVDKKTLIFAKNL
jgi:DNA-directed RNA polymerase subunit RPC12/RpoP